MRNGIFSGFCCLEGYKRRNLRESACFSRIIGDLDPTPLFYII